MTKLLILSCHAKFGWPYNKFGKPKGGVDSGSMVRAHTQWFKPVRAELGGDETRSGYSSGLFSLFGTCTYLLEL